MTKQQFLKEIEHIAESGSNEIRLGNLYDQLVARLIAPEPQPVPQLLPSEKHTDEMTNPIEFVQRRIAQTFKTIENGGAEYYPFDSMELAELPGMHRAYQDMLRFLNGLPLAQSDQTELKKPDFEKLADKDFQRRGSTPFYRVANSLGENLWSEYVLPLQSTIKGKEDVINALQKEYDKLKEERDKLKEENDILTGKYKGASDLNAELQAEIQTLKEERDRFAIGFARFCQVDLRGRTFKDLLEEFKNISKKE